MKSACRAAALGAVLTGGMLASRGDDSKPTPTSLPTVEPSSMQAMPNYVAPPLVDPNTPTAMQDDPEAAVAQTAALREEYMTQQAEFRLETEARKQAYDNDWMLRGYNAEMARQGIGSAADRAAAAAEEIPDPTAPRRDNNSLEPSTTTDANNPPPGRTRSDSASTGNTPASDVPTPMFLPPILPQGDGSTKKVTRLDAWGSTTTVEAVPPSPFLPSDRTNNQDTTTETSLDVPGLTAEREGLGDSNDTAVTDQQMEAITENSNRARKDFLLPTVSSNDSTEFFKRQSEALGAPNSMAMLHPPTAPNNISLGPPPPPPLLKKMPPPTGIRSHIDDPFDLIGGHRD